MTHAIARPGDEWRRFTLSTALAAGLVLAVGLALAYSGEYRVAYHAGLDSVWLDAWGRQLRPAHLFPLTLGVPVLVGYAGVIALAGRRSIAWARFVLVACGAATVAAQMLDGAGLVINSVAVHSAVRGWMGAFPIITAHLFVKIVQALGYLRPPVADVRPSWIVRAWRWVRRTQADLASADADVRVSADAPPAASASGWASADGRPLLPIVASATPAPVRRPAKRRAPARRSAPAPRPPDEVAARRAQHVSPDVAAIMTELGCGRTKAAAVLRERRTATG